MKNIWENPEIQCINRLPMRSHLLPYQCEEIALQEVIAGVEHFTEANTKSTFVKCLDGKWDFQLLQNPAEPKTENWNKINVPGTWTLQGYDKPHYTNEQMPFDCIPPNIPQDNPTGIYKLETEIPLDWKNRRIVLHVGSAESVLIVYVNDKEVGVSKDTRLPAEFDISPYIDWSKPVNAIIELKVIRYSDASFVEDQDQWWFGGIHRSVFLYSTEQTFIADVEAIPVVDKSSIDNKKLKANAKIPLVVTMGYSDFAQEVTRKSNSELDNLCRVIKYSVSKLAGEPNDLKPVKIVTRGTDLCKFNLRENLNQLRKEIELENVDLWSAEHPNLYAVTVSLFESADESDNQIKTGRHIESVCFTIGFKSVEIKNRELLLNNKMVYIHGVNRHEHNAYTGKTLSTAEMLKDIFLMKTHHFNAVRTCHYPDDERWYDLCNRYGLYVLDEANIENHAYYDVLARSDEWSYAYATRIQRMFRRDKNHACIFGWSLGNESGDGQNLVAMVSWLRRMDTTRLVHYEGFVRAEWKQPWSSLEDLARGKGLTDLISPMYPEIKTIVDYAKTRDDYRPIILCEYSHAMGNANGSLADYWEAIESTHGLQGGFIWDWIDQGIASDAIISEQAQKVADERIKLFPNAQGGKYYKYGGDFGDFPCDFDFCLNGLLLPDQTPKPAMQECKALFAPARIYDVHGKQGIFKVENRADFSPLNTLSVNWSVLENGTILASGNHTLPEIEPTETATICIPEIANSLAKASVNAEIIVRFDFVYETDFWYAKKGEICNSVGIQIQKAAGIQEFAEKTGLLSVNKDFIENLLESTKPELCRAIIENEGIKALYQMIVANGGIKALYESNLIPKEVLKEKPAVEWLSKDLHHAIIDKDSIWTGKDALQKEKLADFTKIVTAFKTTDGKPAFKVAFCFTLTNALQEYPRVGVSLPIPASFNIARWYGNGPHENYTDRTFSALKGMYELSFERLEVPYIVPQENGLRTNVTYLELIEAFGRHLHIRSEQPFAFSISKYSVQNMIECLHLSELTDLTKQENPHWVLTLDSAHRGLGTGACGPDTLEKYRIRPGVYKLEFTVW